MAQLALGVIGGVIGFFVSGGNPLGAQIGFALGSILGAIIFAEETVIEGPRQDELSITTSTLGRPLPIVYATYRLGGNLIWGLEIKEVRSEDTEGDIFGFGGTTTVTYTYFGTGAVAVCEGPATILKIWTNNSVLFDKQRETESILDIAGLGFTEIVLFGWDVSVLGLNLSDKLRFYEGTETQLPDPAIQADKGIDITPAFRGTCYFVFDLLPLKDYGNRIPTFSILVTSNPTTTFPLQTATTINDDSAEFSILTKDNFYYMRDGGSIDTTQQTVEFISNTSYTSVYQITLDIQSQGDGFINSATWSDINSRGEILGRVNIEDGGFDDYQQAVWDGDTGRVLRAGRATFGTSVDPYNGGMQWLGPAGQEVIYAAYGSILSIPNWIVSGPSIGPVATYGDHLNLIDGTGGPNFRGTDDDVAAGSFSSLSLNAATGDAGSWDTREHSFTRDNDGNVWTLVHNFSQVTAWVIGMVWPTTDTIVVVEVPAGYTTADTNSNVGLALSYEPQTNSIFWSGNGEGSGGLNFYRITEGTFDHINVSIENDELFAAFRNYTTLPNPDGIMYLTDGGVEDNVQKIDLVNRVVLDNFNTTTLWSLPKIAQGKFYDVRNNAIIGADTDNLFHWMFLDAGSGDAVTDKTIVDDISDRINFNVPVEINSSALTKLREGYLVGRTMSARKVLDQLSVTGFWIGAEIDHQIKYINRGGAIDKSIPEDDLGATTIGGKQPGKLFETKEDLNDLPMEVAVHYIDPDMDYQSGSHSFKRSIEIVETRKTSNVTTALVMLVDDSIQIAQKMIQQLWAERVTLVSKLTWEHIDVTPGDVLQLTSDGTIFQAFVMTTSYDANGIVTLECVTDRAPAFTSDLEGIDTDIPPNVIPRIGPTFYEVLDIPLASDTVDALLTHVVGSPADGISTWPGVQIRKAPNLTTFSLNYMFVQTSDRVAFGRVTNTLATGSRLYMFDRSSSVNIDFITGTMTSKTDTELLNGSNLLLLESTTGNGWEYLRAGTIVVEANGSLTLSNLLRGRRNTENTMDGHSNFDLAILFTSPNTVLLHSEDASSLGNELKFQGITIGSSSGEVKSIDVFNGQSFAPYSPVALFGTLSAGDWTLGWVRRTRVGGAWTNRAWSGLPVSQTDGTIDYEVDIYDTDLDDKVIVRTITTTATANGSVVSTADPPTCFYDNADIVTDFGASVNYVYFKVAQKDTTIGRGEDSFLQFVYDEPGSIAAPSIIGSTYNEHDTDTTTTIFVPTNPTVGNLLLAVIFHRFDNQVYGIPSGWTEEIKENLTKGDMDLAVYSKTVASVEPSSYDWTGGSGHDWMAMMFEIKNGNTTIPIGSSVTVEGDDSIGDDPAPSIIVNFTPGLVIVCNVAEGGIYDMTGPSDFTTLYKDGITGSHGISGGIHSKTWGGLGATGEFPGFHNATNENGTDFTTFYVNPSTAV